jgi:hypothetical protein
MLNTLVVNTCGCQCYKIVTDALQPNRTVYYNIHCRTVMLINWAGPQTAMEMLGLLPWQALQSWLHTALDHMYVPPLNCNDANNNNNNNMRHTAMVMVQELRQQWRWQGEGDGAATAVVMA